MRFYILAASALLAAGCRFDVTALHDVDGQDIPVDANVDSGVPDAVNDLARADRMPDGTQSDAMPDTTPQQDAGDDSAPPADGGEDSLPPQQDAQPGDGPRTCTSLTAVYNLNTDGGAIAFCDKLVATDGGMMTANVAVQPVINLGGEALEVWCALASGTTVPPLSCSGQCSDGAWSTGPCLQLPYSGLSGCRQGGTCVNPPHP